MGVAEGGAIINIFAWTDDFEFMDDAVERKYHVLIQMVILFTRHFIDDIIYFGVNDIARYRHKLQEL